MRISVRRLTVVALVLPFVLPATATCEIQWTIVAADTAGDVGKYCSLALDSQGSPHISYRESITRRLMYATAVGQSWVVEVADSRYDVTGVGTTTSIAPAVDGAVGIAYGDATSNYLHYAERAASWTNRSIAFPTPAGHSSLALGLNGQPHVAYREFGFPQRFMEAERQGSSWISQIIDDATQGPGQWPSLKRAVDGPLSVAYQYGAASDVKFAVRDSSVWNPITVDTVGNTGWYTALAIDSCGTPHIAYFRSGPHDLLHAVRLLSQWQIETVDTTGPTGYYPSIAADKEGNPWIAYSAYLATETMALKLAVKSGGTWIITAIDTVRTLDRIGLGLDAFGRAHVAYYDGWTGDLMYAVGEDPTAVAAPPPFAELSLTAWPNPAIQGQSTLSLALFGSAESADCLVGLYDLSGRRVRTFSVPERQDSRVTLHWDGTDDAGRPVAAGLYIVRAATSDRRTSAKLVVLR